MRRAPGGYSRGIRAFRLLLSLYPESFRDEYGRELTLLFIDRYRDATGWRSRATLWLDALTGLAIHVPKEHCHMMLQDLRDALRSLRRHSVMTATIVLTLGLGIGANATLFSLLNAVVLRTLPVSDPGSLLTVHAAFPLATANRFAGPMIDRLRLSAPDVDIAAMSRVARAYARGDGSNEAEPAALQLVSSNYFRVLGVAPSLGGTLTAEADRAAIPRAVISHQYWQRRFGSSPDVLGRTLTINGTSFSIAGVAPEGFTGVWLESPVDLWVPLTMDRQVKYMQNYSMDKGKPRAPWLPQETIWWLDVIARAAPGRLAATTAALEAGARNVAGNDAKIELEPFARGMSTLRQRFTTPLFALMSMAGLVLLIACANVANLLLARAAGRQRELAIRMSLGAGRGRLMHQLLTESVLLVLLSGGAALLFAHWSGDLLVRTATAAVSGRTPFAAVVDLRVWGFTAAVALVSLVFFGLMPAWRTTRLDVAAAMKGGGRGTSDNSGTRPARLLVVLQVALSLVLVTATGLLVRSFHNLTTLDLGFERAHLLSISLETRLAGDRPEELSSEETAALQQRVLDGVAAVAGVASASLAMCGVHATCSAREDGFKVDGYQPADNEQIVFLVNSVSPNYFSTLGTRMIAGRSFTEGDTPESPTIAVVNRTLARKYFPDGQAIGRRFGNPTNNIEIVGIVDDARLLKLRDSAIPTAYFAMAQRRVSARAIEVRTHQDPRQLIGPLRAAVSRAAPGLPIEYIRPFDERMQANLSEERLMVFLASGFGVLALGLAGFGLFGLLSCAVARRASEFGIRLALGGSPSSVLWSVVRESMWLVALGVLVGAPVVAIGGHVTSSLFFGVSPYDGRTFAAATAILLAVGSWCSLVPALRASRVDPLVMLRQE